MFNLRARLLQHEDVVRVAVDVEALRARRREVGVHPDGQPELRPQLVVEIAHALYSIQYNTT